MFKIPALDLEDSLRVDIVDPANRPAGIWLKIASPDSARAKEAKRIATDKRLSAKRKVTATDIDEEDADYYARIVMEWGGDALKDTAGNTPALTKIAAAALFAEYPMVLEQVKIVHSDRANFIKRSSSD